MDQSSESLVQEEAKYKNEFAGKTFVIKVGGDIFNNPAVKTKFLQDIHYFHAVIGMNVVLVHGAGPQTSAEVLKRPGLKVEIDPATGQRITNKATLSCVKSAQFKLNEETVMALNAIQAASGDPNYTVVGLPREELFNSNITNPITRAIRVEALGFVGNVDEVNVSRIMGMFKQNILPVFHSMSIDGRGDQLNINADFFADLLSAKLESKHLILVTKSGGLYENFDKPNQRLISKIDIKGVRYMLDNTHDLDGMKVKLLGALAALERTGSYVESVHISSPSNMKKEIFRSFGAGTMIVPQLENPSRPVFNLGGVKVGGWDYENNIS